MKILAFAMLVVIALKTAESSFASKCVKALGDANFRKRTISVFYSVNRASPDEKEGHGLSVPLSEVDKCLDASLMALMATWPVQLCSDMAKTVPAMQQLRSPLEAVIVFLNNQTTFQHLVKVIKTQRVVGSITKVIIVLKDDIQWNVSESQQHVWQHLRAISSYISVYNDSAISFFNITFRGNATFSNLKHTFLQPSDCSNVTFPNKIREVAPSFSFKIVGEDEDEPYIFFNTRKHEADGICVRTMKSVVQLLNSSLETSILEDYGQALDGDDFSDQFGLMYRYDLDMICGNCYLYRNRLYGFEVLSLFDREQYVGVHVKPPVIVAGATVQGLVAEFSASVWVCFGLVWLSSSVVLYANQCFMGQQGRFLYTVFGVFSGTLGNSYVGLQDSFRVFLGIFSLYNIVILASYTSGLVGHLAVPRQGKMFNNWGEADAAGIVNISIGSLSLVQRLKLVESNNLLYTRVMRKSVETWILRNFTKSDRSHNFYFTESSTLISAFTYWFMSPAHPLFPIVSHYIGLLIQAGILGHWQRQIFFEELIASIYGKSHANAEKKKTIPLDHVLGAFALYSVCIATSFIVFACEMLTKHLVPLKNERRLK